MTQAERAKQFAPFDAMKGLQEALRDREERHARVERHDISEEDIERNSSVLAKKAIFLFFLLSGYAGVGRDLCFLYLRGVVDLHDRDLRHGAYYSS